MMSDGYGLGLGRRWCDAGHDVVDSDVEFTVWWDVELPEISSHGAASVGEKVAVQPGAVIVVAGGEEAWQWAAAGLEEAFGAFVLGVPSTLEEVTGVR